MRPTHAACKPGRMGRRRRQAHDQATRQWKTNVGTAPPRHQTPKVLRDIYIYLYIYIPKILKGGAFGRETVMRFYGDFSGGAITAPPKRSTRDASNPGTSRFLQNPLSGVVCRKWKEGAREADFSHISYLPSYTFIYLCIPSYTSKYIEILS